MNGHIQETLFKWPLVEVSALLRQLDSTGGCRRPFSNFCTFLLSMTHKRPRSRWGLHSEQMCWVEQLHNCQYILIRPCSDLTASPVYQTGPLTSWATASLLVWPLTCTTEKLHSKHYYTSTVFDKWMLIQLVESHPVVMFDGCQVWHEQTSWAAG